MEHALKLIGIWILLSFVSFYFLALLTSSKHIEGCLVIGMVLGLGLTLAFFL
jgi:hypothetical protein